MVLIAGTIRSHFKAPFFNVIRNGEHYRINKPWGHELWINGEHPGYVLKKIGIKRGNRTSLQYHNFKEETNLLVQGRVALAYSSDKKLEDNEAKADNIDSVEITPLTSIHVMPKSIHRLEAIENSLLYEVSTPHLDDVIRISDDTHRSDGRIATEHTAGKTLDPVCILTAGHGTRMFDLSDIVNKALLPLGRASVLTKIFECFPKGTPFVIALGYKGQQVRDYVTLAHPDLSVTFVEVENYSGPGSGPGLSLLCCRDYLKCPFYFISCDTLFNHNLSSLPSGNWAGVAKVPIDESKRYCNFKIKDGLVVELRDKEKVGAEYMAFIGLLYVRDYETFWTALADNYLMQGEHQISNGLRSLIDGPGLQAIECQWIDVGTFESYKKAAAAYQDFDFSKKNEYMYFVGKRAVKFFTDTTIVKNRVAKAKLRPQLFPKIVGAGEQFYSYNLALGETLYACNLPMIFDKFLLWLDQEVWKPFTVSPHRMREICQVFYQDKTLKRLEAFEKKYPNITPPMRMNGCPLHSLESLLSKIPWKTLFDGIPTFIHGDLQFDNVIYDPVEDQFTLIDWRQNFGAETMFGDLYYDVAKLHGGITLNYDYIKKNLLTVKHCGDDIFIDFAQRFSAELLNLKLKSYIERRGMDFGRVELLTAIIYLNMSPLHEPPFDRALHTLGRWLLSRILV